MAFDNPQMVFSLGIIPLTMAVAGLAYFQHKVYTLIARESAANRLENKNWKIKPEMFLLRQRGVIAMLGGFLTIILPLAATYPVTAIFVAGGLTFGVGLLMFLVSNVG